MEILPIPILVRTTHKDCIQCGGSVSDYSHNHCYVHAIDSELTYHLRNPGISRRIRENFGSNWIRKYAALKIQKVYRGFIVRRNYR